MLKMKVIWEKPVTAKFGKMEEVCPQPSAICSFLNIIKIFIINTAKM